MFFKCKTVNKGFLIALTILTILLLYILIPLSSRNVNEDVIKSSAVLSAEIIPIISPNNVNEEVNNSSAVLRAELIPISSTNNVNEEVNNSSAELTTGIIPLSSPNNVNEEVNNNSSAVLRAEIIPISSPNNLNEEVNNSSVELTTTIIPLSSPYNVNEEVNNSSAELTTGIIPLSSPTNQSLINNNTKVILLWTAMFSYNNWGMGYNSTVAGPDFFTKRNCPFNCAMTLQRDLFPSVDQYAAIVFHGVPGSQTIIPSVRSPQQLYVHGVLEAPPFVEPRLAKMGHLKNFYNLTMSFRFDADIFWPYMTVEDLEGNVIAPNPHYETKWIPFNSTFYNQELYDLAVNKSKKIAWFASNCKCQSRRSELIANISKLMHVDIYGECGPLKCPRSDEAKCNEMLDTDYKFYLGFENALCTDYVTEKLLGYMRHSTVVVVYGGGQYTRHAPPHSYINANDFDTPADLVKYLTFLDENPVEYIKYFWWRDHYTISKQRPFPFCDLCKKLHDKRSLSQTKFYHDINEIPWSSSYMCNIKPHIQF